MGGSSERMRVASLNYSGIFVSPFEFYAMDNWQQLQKIGSIFEENLKSSFMEIKMEIKSIDPKQAPADDYYIRKKFDWKIDKLDKVIKEQRLSPLYINEFKEKNQYAGIKHDGSLLNEIEFKEEWTNSKQKFPEIKFSDLEMSLCRRFDFECFRAIVMYLYSKPEHAHFFDGREPSDKQILKFEEIMDRTKKKEREAREEMVNAYREFMAGYFKRIDSPSKIQMTVDYLFDKWDLEVINLQEVNIKLRERLYEQDKYFVFAPADELEADQCILLVRKDLHFVPAYFRQHYEAEQKYVGDLRDLTEKTLKNYENFEKHGESLKRAVSEHFNEAVSNRILKKMNEQVSQGKFKEYREITRLLVFSELMNPLKGEFDRWMEEYTQPFLNYFEAKKNALKEDDKDRKVMGDYLKELKELGLLFWTEAFILTNFGFTHRDLQREVDTQKRLLFGSFHLSSKEAKNKIQVQIIGILIYELAIRNYKLVFAGDFNSHIVIVEKENTESLFAFVKHYYQKKQQQSKGSGSKGLMKVSEYQSSFAIFPKHPMIFTTKKKRTILQVQAKKSNLLAEKSIDQILSNIPIVIDQCYTGEVSGLGSGQNKNKSFIPNMEHPYDHFVVQALLDLTSLEESK